jgi:hypothetical protein
MGSQASTPISVDKSKSDTTGRRPIGVGLNTTFRFGDAATCNTAAFRHPKYAGRGRRRPDETCRGNMLCLRVRSIGGRMLRAERVGPDLLLTISQSTWAPPAQSGFGWRALPGGLDVRALIEGDLPQRLINRLRQVHAGVYYGWPSRALRGRAGGAGMSRGSLVLRLAIALRRPPIGSKAL